MNVPSSRNIYITFWVSLKIKRASYLLHSFYENPLDITTCWLKIGRQGIMPQSLWY